MAEKRWLAMVACLAASTGCFHQVVQTGRAPGSTVIDKPFVATWLWGLVAAPEIDVRKECPTGVAVVTTEQSFVDGLIGVVTIGIYIPQHVTITCASGTASLPRGAAEMTVGANATVAQSAEVLAEAVALSNHNNAPVVIRVENTLPGDHR